MEHSELSKLTQVVKKLRDPKEGCPWDLKQTHNSLLKYLIEESYEFIHATEEGKVKDMEEELGDILLQILLHTTIGEEKKSFTLESVAKTLKEKLIRRHPHVFEDKNTNINISEVVTNWDQIKKEERKEKGEKEEETTIKNRVLHLPSLSSAYQIGKATQKMKFDWDDASQVLYKVEEEWQELKEELTPHKLKNKNAIEEELGDFLFSTAQLARHLNIDPEQALRQANKKFLKRFRSMELLIIEDKKNILEMNQKEMDYYWDQAKINERHNL